MTTVATFGATPVACAAVPVPSMRHRNFRISDRTWITLSRIAELRKERTSEVMRRLAEDYIHKHRALVKDDAVLEERLRELDEKESGG